MAPDWAIRRAAANVIEAPDRTALEKFDIVPLVYNGASDPEWDRPPGVSFGGPPPDIMVFPMQIEKVYEPQRFEPHWAQWWIDSGVFHASQKAQPRVFSLVIPPPNVTGSLHIGHMLEHTEIDVTIRWHRMRGDNTLWLPGTDHAGIATQMVVERKLAEEGLDRRTMGRENSSNASGNGRPNTAISIKRQMIRLGASCDWSRERFTLDPGLSRAVREVFVRLYEKGLIYRGEYMVNWCPRCQTALSDLEVEHTETQGHLWHIRYPVNGATGRFVTVATTRPETMLGDTAVAINAKDARYFDLHGKTVRSAADGSRDPHHSRRSRRPRIRHRRGEGHPRARSQRFRSRQAPQSAAHQGHRRKRPHDRRSRPLRRPRPLRSPPPRGRRPGEPRPARKGRAVHAQPSAAATAARRWSSR